MTDRKPPSSEQIQHLLDIESGKLKASQEELAALRLDDMNRRGEIPNGVMDALTRERTARVAQAVRARALVARGNESRPNLVNQNNLNPVRVTQRARPQPRINRPRQQPKVSEIDLDPSRQVKLDDD